MEGVVGGNQWAYRGGGVVSRCTTWILGGSVNGNHLS